MGMQTLRRIKETNSRTLLPLTDKYFTAGMF
jgi:hypothetical protein